MKIINLDSNENYNGISIDDHIIYDGKRYEFTQGNFDCDKCDLCDECYSKLEEICSKFFCSRFKLISKLVDNFDLISAFLPEDKINNEFYHVQILRRKKENPDIGCNSILINSYFIRDQKHLNRVKEEIILLCKLYNARAYINLNVRDKEKLVLPMMNRLLTYLENKQYASLQTTLNSVCDSNPAKKERFWIIDVDKLEMSSEYLNELVTNIDSFSPKGSKLKTIIPTVNGWHIITKPFNSLEFSKIYPELDVKKDNATLLYYGS